MAKIFRRKPTNSVYGKLSKLEKDFVRKYSFEELQLFENMQPEDLEKIVIETSAVLIKARRERDNDPDYKRALEIAKEPNDTYKEIKSFQTTKQKMALKLLGRKGRVDLGEEEDEL
jgi:hypothetical protein